MSAASPPVAIRSLSHCLRPLVVELWLHRERFQRRHSRQSTAREVLAESNSLSFANVYILLGCIVVVVEDSEQDDKLLLSLVQL